MPIMLSPPNERDYAPLRERLASLGRMRKRVAGAAGIFSLIAASIAAIALACGLDAWLHVAALPRAFALVGTLATAGIIWFRRIEPAFRLSTHSLAIALELEERFPRLNDSLASAVSFLGEGTNDSRGVSRTLRSAAVRRAERLAERHDFEQLVPSGRGWRNFWLAAVVVGAAVPLALWNTDRTATALVRFGGIL